MVKLVAGVASMLMAMTVAVSAAASPTTGGPQDVPVAATFDFSPSRSAEHSPARGVIHAVRRVPGGTVIYWSVGNPQGSEDVPGGVTLTQEAELEEYGVSQIYSLSLVDTYGLKQYRPMIGSDDKCLCSSVYDYPDMTLKPGALYSGYAVVPPLPASVKSVTVMAFYGAMAVNVPVGDGDLEPVAPQGKSITRLDEGWPAVPVEKIASVSRPERFILPLQARTSDIEQTVRKQESATKVTVDLSADVLFAVDSATLTPAATGRIRSLALDILKRGRGVVQVVGHTDSTGDDAHNMTLSQRRAQSVLAALKPLVTSGPTFQAIGKGESEPQASNDSAAERQLNRRVTLTYTVTSK